LLGEYQRAVEASGDEFGYGRPLALTALGRTEEALATLRQGELARPWRLGKSFLTSLRAFLEGHREESLQACEEIRKSTFRDPEGIYYIARQFSYLGQGTEALEMLARAIEHGFFCYPTMVRDPWLDALRSRPEFTDLLRKSHQLHREASAVFVAAGGDALLGMRAEGY